MSSEVMKQNDEPTASMKIVAEVTEQNVRTRREQLASYPETVCVGRYSDGSWQLRRDADHLDEDLLVEGPVLYVRCDIAHQSQTEAAERGAAEQRRKDAEGQEPRTCNHCRGTGEEPGAYYLDGSPYSCSVCDGSGVIYLQPANVAAMEARIAELEGALRAADQFITNGVEFGFIRMPDIDTNDSAHDTPRIVRAALTREGGV